MPRVDEGTARHERPSSPATASLSSRISSWPNSSTHSSPYYGRPRKEIADAARALLALPSVASDHKPLLRTIELYEADRLDFADAYVCASAETSGIGKVASFDRRIDRVKSIERLEP